MKEINDRIIKNYILGRCSQKEIEQLYEWINSSEEHALWLFDQVDAYKTGKASRFTAKQVQQKVEMNVFRRIHEERKRPFFCQKRFLYYAAAALLIFLSVTAVYFSRTTVGQIEVRTVAKEVKQVVLPDGSKVWLNENTTLTYPKIFGDDQRKVVLKGEGYFVVAKDTVHPFVVKSTHLTTKVLGTVFNFNTDDRKHHTEEVTLIEGKVRVEGNHDEGSITLRPKQKVVFNTSTNSIEVEETPIPLETVWHSHLIPFRNIHIHEIATIIEQLYQTKVQIHPTLKDNSTYSGAIRHTETIDSMLRDLSYSIPFSYKIKKGKVELYAR